eukprot:m.139969 g.139969  ORF g.139969 m.139969 type:complete len:539 (+) comp16100_c0_seq11:85-1701(+)
MEAPGRRQRMPPSALRDYFQGLSDVHADVLTEMDGVVAEAAGEEWQELSENQRDRLLSAPFLLTELTTRKYSEDDFGGTVQEVREDARQRVQHMQWQDEIAQKKSEKERQRRRKARGKAPLTNLHPKQRSKVQIVHTAADAVESRHRAATIAGSQPASSQGSAASLEYDLARIQRRHPSRGISAFLDGAADSEHMPTSSKALAALALTPVARRHHHRSTEELSLPLTLSQDDLRSTSGTSTDPVATELDVDLIHATRDSGTGSRVSRAGPTSPVSVTRKGNKLITRFSANELLDDQAAANPSPKRPATAFEQLESLVSLDPSSTGEYIQVAAHPELDEDDVTSPLNASGHIDTAWQAGGDDLDVATSVAAADTADDFDQLVAAFGLTSGAKTESKVRGSPQRKASSTTVRRQAPMPLVKAQPAVPPESSTGPLPNALPVRLGDTRKPQNGTALSGESNEGSTSRIRKLPARKRVPTRKSSTLVLEPKPAASVKGQTRPEPQAEKPVQDLSRGSVSPKASPHRSKMLNPTSPTVAFSNI